MLIGIRSVRQNTWCAIFSPNNVLNSSVKAANQRARLLYSSCVVSLFSIVSQDLLLGDDITQRPRANSPTCGVNWPKRHGIFYAWPNLHISKQGEINQFHNPIYQVKGNSQRLTSTSLVDTSWCSVPVNRNSFAVRAFVWVATPLNRPWRGCTGLRGTWRWRGKKNANGRLYSSKLWWRVHTCI